MDNPEEEKKQINIIGQNNRYQIKKLTTNKTVIKRKNIPDEQEQSHETQQKMIEYLFYHKITDNQTELYSKEIKHKISSYKQQDLLKKIHDTDSFVSFDYVLEKLVESKLRCCYCSQNVYIIYQLVRELMQWSLDRINNNIGHNVDNVVIACLNCNLKRRNQSKDAFMFTKNLQITRETYKKNDTI